MKGLSSHTTVRTLLIWWVYVPLALLHMWCSLPYVLYGWGRSQVKRLAQSDWFRARSEQHQAYVTWAGERHAALSRKLKGEVRLVRQEAARLFKY